MRKLSKKDVQRASQKPRVKKSRSASLPRAEASPAGPAKLERMVEELWLHQQELEIQNKALLEMQGALEASRDEYARLYDSAPVGYLTIDAAARIHRCNLAAARLLGADRAKLVGGLLTTHVARADAAPLLAHLDSAIRGDRSATVEVRLRRRASESAIVRLESGPVERSSHPGAFCLMAMVDVTETRKLQEERERVERKLQETQRLESLGVLAGGIAHDFNNLLAAILGRASLGSMVRELDPAVHEHFCQIEIAAERAADLCKQMMSYAGRGELAKHAIDVNGLLAGEERLLRAAIHHGVRLDFDLQTELPPVRGDLTQLRQLVMNLVINASESCELHGGSVLVRTRVTRATASDLAAARIGSHLPEADYLTIEVRDEGAGMSASTLNKIFEPFFSTKFAGRGLGLAVVLGIVRRHAGALQVESEIGVGTTFRCWLPLAEESSVPEAANREAPSFDPRASSYVVMKAQRGETILVVDDDDAVRTTAMLMLEGLGFAVLGAASGQEALALFAQHRHEVSAVLLDLSMPEMDGRDVFRGLLRSEPSLRVLMMSGFERREALRGFGRVRPQGFLQKPLRVEALHAALGKLLLGAAPRARSSTTK
jgi:PAS domain S-box-containing protein